MNRSFPQPPNNSQLRFAICEFPLGNCELRVVICELRVVSCELPLGSYTPVGSKKNMEMVLNIILISLFSDMFFT